MNAKESRRRRRSQIAKPPAKKMIPVRIADDLVERVDALRPEYIPREPFIRQILSEKIEEMEEQQEGEEE
jgi:metal-responsive CopG/Arc/MetJ family transcriptional regulator